MGAFRVGKPRVKLGLLAAWSFTGGNPAVPWDRLWFEEPAGITPALPVTGWTITKPGLWLICATIQRAAYAQPAAPVMRIRVNGVDRSAIVGPVVPGSYGLTNTTLEDLAVNDVVSLHIQSGTAAQGPTTVNPLSFLSLTRIGPDRWT